MRRIAARDASKTVWYSSTRIGFVGRRRECVLPGPNRLGEPDVPRRRSYDTCRPFGSQRISALTLKS